MNYLRNAMAPAPVSEAIPGTVKNDGGGHSYAVEDWTRLDRFLILGSEGGSYYTTEQKLTRDNARAVERCIQKDGQEVVRRIVEVSDSGRAPKNDPAIFALALCLKMGDTETRRAAARAVPEVCRIGTHIQHLAAFLNDLGGWGRVTKRAIANWYTSKQASALAYQLVKYQSRDGWSNRDLLRLSHPKAPSVDHATLFAWATGKTDVDSTLLPPVVAAFESFKDSAARHGDIPTPGELAYIRDSGFPREGLPTQWLTRPAVWEAMLPKMGLTALLRNLATMTRIGLLAPGNNATTVAIARLTDEAELRGSRVHPIAVLSAMRTYASGRSVKGSSTWSPVRAVVDALDAAFYKAFGNVKPTNKRIELALDVSGSMSSGEVAGVPGLTPREASVAMAMVTLAVEPKATTSAFSTRYIRDLDISPRRRLDDNVRAVSNFPFAGTDCSLPMLMAMKEQREVDAFFVYTDNETNYGVHPSEALREYRRRHVKDAKLGVISLLANGFSIADPLDKGMLDVVGFDTATPNVLADFVAG